MIMILFAPLTPTYIAMVILSIILFAQMNNII
jgi:hypothetical protein